jgi:hypothetical protein
MHEDWLERTPARVRLPQKSTKIRKEKSLCALRSFVAIRLAPPMPVVREGRRSKRFWSKRFFFHFLDPHLFDLGPFPLEERKRTIP